MIPTDTCWPRRVRQGFRNQTQYNITPPPLNYPPPPLAHLRPHAGGVESRFASGSRHERVQINAPNLDFRESAEKYGLGKTLLDKPDLRWTFLNLRRAT